MKVFGKEEFVDQTVEEAFVFGAADTLNGCLYQWLKHCALIVGDLGYRNGRHVHGFEFKKTALLASKQLLSEPPRHSRIENCQQVTPIFRDDDAGFIVAEIACEVRRVVDVICDRRNDDLG